MHEIIQSSLVWPVTRNCVNSFSTRKNSHFKNFRDKTGAKKTPQRKFPAQYLNLADDATVKFFKIKPRNF